MYKIAIYIRNVDLAYLKLYKIEIICMNNSRDLLEMLICKRNNMIESPQLDITILTHISTIDIEIFIKKTILKKYIFDYESGKATFSSANDLNWKLHKFGNKN